MDTSMPMKAPAVNFAAIHQELLKGIHANTGADVKDQDWMAVSNYLIEYRTIGITLPRQCGKSHWIAEQLKKSKMAVAFVSDDLNLKNMVENLGADPSQVITLRQLIEVNADAPWAHIRPEIYIDNALYFFSNISKKHVYKLIGNSVGTNALITLVS